MFKVRNTIKLEVDINLLKEYARRNNVVINCNYPFTDEIINEKSKSIHPNGEITNYDNKYEGFNLIPNTSFLRVENFFYKSYSIILDIFNFTKTNNVDNNGNHIYEVTYETHKIISMGNKYDENFEINDMKQIVSNFENLSLTYLRKNTDKNNKAFKIAVDKIIELNSQTNENNNTLITILKSISAYYINNIYYSLINIPYIITFIDNNNVNEKDIKELSRYSGIAVLSSVTSLVTFSTSENLSNNIENIVNPLAKQYNMSSDSLYILGKYLNMNDIFKYQDTILKVNLDLLSAIINYYETYLIFKDNQFLELGKMLEEYDNIIDFIDLYDIDIDNIIKAIYDLKKIVLLPFLYSQKISDNLAVALFEYNKEKENLNNFFKEDNDIFYYYIKSKTKRYYNPIITDEDIKKIYILASKNIDMDEKIKEIEKITALD